MAKAGITVTTDMGGVTKKIDSIVGNRKVQTFAAQAAAGLMEKRVPLDKGALRTFVRVLPLQVDYTVPYAKHVFYGETWWHWTTPGTGPHWDEMDGTAKKDLAKHITDYIARL